jgi:hypothetical protein
MPIRKMPHNNWMNKTSKMTKMKHLLISQEYTLMRMNTKVTQKLHSLRIRDALLPKEEKENDLKDDPYISKKYILDD